MTPDRSSGAGLLCFESQKVGGNSVGISKIINLVPLSLSSI